MSKTNSIIVEAGEYFIGDPCYALSDETYNRMCEQLFTETKQSVSGMNVTIRELVDGLLTSEDRDEAFSSMNKVTLDGNDMFVFHTRLGDGEIRLFSQDSSKGNMLYVDSGMIALIPISQVRPEVHQWDWKYNKDRQIKSCPTKGCVVSLEESRASISSIGRLIFLL